MVDEEHPFLLPSSDTCLNLVVRSKGNLPNKLVLRTAEWHPASITENGEEEVHGCFHPGGVDALGIARVAQVHIIVAIVDASVAFKCGHNFEWIGVDASSIKQPPLSLSDASTSSPPGVPANFKYVFPYFPMPYKRPAPPVENEE